MTALFAILVMSLAFVCVLVLSYSVGSGYDSNGWPLDRQERELEYQAQKLLNDGNQEKWENGELGNDAKYAVVNTKKEKV